MIRGMLLAGLMLFPSSAYAQRLDDTGMIRIEQRKDGYTNVRPEYVRTELNVKIVYYQSFRELKAAYLDIVPNTQALRQINERDLRAFSQIKQGVCVIHMIDPRVKYLPEFYGHELIHCSMGRWHD